MSAGMTSKRLKGFCFTWVGRERERDKTLVEIKHAHGLGHMLASQVAT